MVVEVGPEVEQLIFEIYSRPAQRVIQILASPSADDLWSGRWESEPTSEAWEA